MKEQAEKLINIKKRIADAILKLKLDEKESELETLEAQTKNPKFWKDQDNAKDITQKINSLKQIIEPWRLMENDATHLFELLNTLEDKDSNLLLDIENKIKELQKILSIREKDAYFSGKYDEYNAVLSIYAGAGGIDAQDWAEMLLSMYLKYTKKENLSSKIISISSGQEAGIKSVSVEVEGPFAYGKLKSERGVHRLVRISPYDADKARHTSFALVEVIPEIEKEDIQLNDKDLKIETFKSSGHGGQSVNTTDSAVRLTHLPTKTTVSVQNERSQLQNRERALKILKARIATIKEAEKEKELKIIKGDQMSAEWGSQIRSYVIHPYQMVKDHRTKIETSNTDDVLKNGNLDIFIEGYLKSG